MFKPDQRFLRRLASAGAESANLCDDPWVYAIDPRTDLSPLVGCSLTFVGFSEHQLQLGLSRPPDCSIAVEGDYSVTDGQKTARYTTPASGSTALLHLLGRIVTRVTIIGRETVRLEFGEYASIQVHDSSRDAESFQIDLPDRVLVV